MPTPTIAATLTVVTSTTASVSIAYNYSEHLSRVVIALETIATCLNTLTQYMSTGTGVRTVSPYDWIQGMQLDKLFDKHYDSNFPKWDPYE